MTKMPLGTTTTQNDSDAILKWIFNKESKQEPMQAKLKDSETTFKELSRVLTHGKTKMPLGAKLTQNDFKYNF
jgi:hypothetical protein